MKTLLLSTALISATAFAVMAQTGTAPETAPAAPETMNQTDPLVPAPEAAPADVTETAPADAPAGTMITDAEPTLPEGFVAADVATLTTETLVGARVHDANDEWIGSVSELIVGADGQITNAVVDVGGFLGIGAKPVSLTLPEMQIVRAAEGDEVRIYVTATKETLELMPAYEG